MGRTRLLAAAMAALAVLVAVTGAGLFPVCEFEGMRVTTEGGGTIPMKCLWAARAEMGVGLLIAATSVALMFATSPQARRLLAVPTIGGFALVMMIPTWLIGVCAGQTHPCRVGTQPAWLLEGGVGLVLAAVALALAGWGREAPPDR